MVVARLFGAWPQAGRACRETGHVPALSDRLPFAEHGTAVGARPTLFLPCMLLT